MRPTPQRTTYRSVATALAAVVLSLAKALPAQTQSRTAMTAEGGIDRPIGREARRTDIGSVGGVALEMGDVNSGRALLAMINYARMDTKLTRANTGDLSVWSVAVGGLWRSDTSRPIGALVTLAPGVAIVDEAATTFIARRRDWQPLLSAGLGAEYRRAALQLRLRSEVWVQPLTYSRDGYGARAAVRTTLGIGFVRSSATLGSGPTATGRLAGRREIQRQERCRPAQCIGHLQ